MFGQSPQAGPAEAGLGLDGSMSLAPIGSGDWVKKAPRGVLLVSPFKAHQRSGGGGGHDGHLGSILQPPSSSFFWGGILAAK